MAMTYKSERKLRLESRARDRAEYKMILAITFAFFVVHAVLARVFALFRLPFEGPGPKRKTIIAEAWESANSVLPYAFMG